MASILAVDDEPENLELLEAVLRPAGHTIRKATGGREALQAVEQEAPELILLDLMMPGVSGFEVCEMLRANERTARIPIIIVTALDQLPVKERVLSLGADDFLTKPIQGVEVVARVEAMLRVRHLRQDLDRALAYLHELEIARHENRRRRLEAAGDAFVGLAREPGDPKASMVLLVDDEEMTRQFYGDLLVQHGFHVVAVASGSEALEAAPRHPLEAVLLDIMMPELSGLETLGQLHERFPDLPVIILTAHPSSQNAITALKLGAFDFIVKGLQPELLVVAVRRAIHRSAELREKRELIGALEARIRELEARLAAIPGTPEARSPIP
jgi:two-component system cell cycle response regulator